MGQSSRPGPCRVLPLRDSRHHALCGRRISRSEAAAGNPQRRARMTQICAILDHYGWNPMVIQVFVQGALIPIKGGAPDRAVIAKAMPQAELALKTIESLTTGGEFLCGTSIAWRIVPGSDPRLFLRTEDGRAAMKPYPRISTWWQKIEAASSVINTRPSFSDNSLHYARPDETLAGRHKNPWLRIPPWTYCKFVSQLSETALHRPRFLERQTGASTRLR